MKNRAKVSLVGAGPGDPDLLTIKGLNAIRSADAILYDRLVSPDLLDYASQKTEKLYVGKKAGKHSHAQSDINYLLVAYAFSYGHVVRLKGGDPYIFGRGYEEKTYIESFGLPVEVIPGISSVNAVPASIDIPLTCRGVNESFWVITATTSSMQLSKDLSLAAQSSATIVILMGLRKLREIVAVFCAMGKYELPIAVISAGTTRKAKSHIGKISDILCRMEKDPLPSPALIVIGEVVALQKDKIYEKGTAAFHPEVARLP